MQAATRCKNIFRFGPFEYNSDTRELRKHGLRVQLVGQPVEVLTLLLQRPGEVVPREDLQNRLWPSDTFVEFENGLNAAVKRLRERLGDSADKPRYIETIPRLGYRFIAPVITPTNGAGAPVPGSGVQSVAELPHRAAIAASKLKLNFSSRWQLGVVALVVTVAVVSLLYWVALARRATPSAPATIRSIAVLPFANLSGDSEQEYFADGMTDELITSISKISELKVISRTSVTRYKRTNKPLPTIARELNVDGIVEGTVLRSGDRVRITIQLLHGPSDTHLWAETYERNLRDVLTLQYELAQAVARQVKATLRSPDEASQTARKRSLDPKAYELYLKGRYYFGSLQVEKAATNFREAIKLEPQYAQAYAGLAESYVLFEPQNAAPHQEAISNAKAAALRALEIDENVAEANVSLGWAKMTYDWDWAGAEAEFKRAIELNPNDETAHLWYGCELVWEKRFDEGLAEMRRAQEVAPASAHMAAFFGMGLYQARRYGEAIERSKDALELDPTFPAAYQWLGLTYAALGRYDEAITKLEKSRQFSKDRGVRITVALSRLGYGYGVAGRRKDALAILKELQEVSTSRHVPPSHFAVVYIGIGDKDRAFEWLNKGFKERSYEMALLRSDPRFDSLRNDPRFQNLIEGMKFPK
jgi:TolB-like protein/DNA-binding winged helix-turn-helix (wHTH) protein/Flp pilus assembly protein TadD